MSAECGLPSSRLAIMEVTVRKSALGRRSCLSPRTALLAMGALRPRLANASSEVKPASAPPTSGFFSTVLPSSSAPPFTASRLISRLVVMGVSAGSSPPAACCARSAGIAYLASTRSTCSVSSPLSSMNLS